MKQILIYGASGFGREVAWLAESCNVQVTCFIDDDPATHGNILNGIKVLSLADARATFPAAAVVGGVGSPQTRHRLMDKARDADFEFTPLLHPGVQKSRWIEMGEGTVICAGCILTTNIHLGHHVQINLACTIGHDVVLGDYTTLAPGVHVSGWVHLGKRVYVGTGTVFINGTENAPLMIGDDAVIGAGAVVTQSVPPGETWGGVPAKPLRK
ncbi:MAG: acetyltransferase [Desulfobacterales bacterium]|jgi:sugar O-acyltransferase (sialic acid O-acetyltransferase NeuD family)|nr:acetyltransferase [Desulfobacterales bacterium]